MSNKLVKTYETRKQATKAYFNKSNLHIIDVDEVDINKVINDAEQVIIAAKTEGKPIEWDHPEYAMIGNAVVIFPTGLTKEAMKALKKAFD